MKKVSTFVPKLTKPLLKNQGRLHNLILDWDAIVPYDWAQYVKPLRVSGSVLTIGVPAVLSTTVHFQMGVLIELINGYYGQALLTQIKIKSLKSHEITTPLRPAPITPKPGPVDQDIIDAGHPALAEALARLVGYRKS